jgi:hypothetical protein
MDATVQVALTGAIVAALVNAIIAPRINWGIERRREDSKYKKECINAWRKLVADLSEYYKIMPDTVPQIKENPIEFLGRSTAFYSLRPLLTPTAMSQLNTVSHEHIRDVLIDEIARIEKEWSRL